jgi:hypothetical protein
MRSRSGNRAKVAGLTVYRGDCQNEKRIAKSIFFSPSENPENVFRPRGSVLRQFLCTIFSISTVIKQFDQCASARSRNDGPMALHDGSEMPKSGKQIGHFNSPFGLFARLLFTAYIVDRKGDRYGHYNLRLGCHAPQERRRRSHAFRPAGSRASSAGSVDD